jgi:hypothetical protein
MLLLAIIWASPGTLLGLAAGMLGLATGGRVQRVGRVLEFHGGAVTWLLARLPLVGGAAAMTLGHVVLGRSRDDLEWSREHELVHVLQYERWGPLFIPAYLLCSALLWIRGKNAYLDNPFEREAYGKAG